MQSELIGLCCLCVLLSSALQSQRLESQQAGLFTNTHWAEGNVSLDRLHSYCSRNDTDADVYKSFTDDVITDSAASSHMRLNASGVCHEEMWAYSGGPAAVCLHCSVRCNCSRFSCRSCFFLGTFSLLLPSGQAGQYGGTAPLLNYTATGDFY